MSNFFSRVQPFFHSVRAFIKNNKKVSIAIIFLCIAIIYYFFYPKSSSEETVKVTKGNLNQVVKVMGFVKAVSEADMSFEKSAPVTYIGVNVGDTVYAGKVLATVSSGDEESSLLQAQASLDNVKAVLNQLNAGARKEEIAIKEQILNASQSNLDTVYTSLPDSIHNTDAVTSDIIKSKLASMFNYSGGRYTLSFSSCDQSTQSVVESKRLNIDADLINFQKSAGAISSISSTNDIDKTFLDAYNITIKTNDLVSSLSSVLLAPCSSSNSALDGYRTTLSTVKVSINSLFTDISTKKSNLISAKNSLGNASSDFNLIKAAADPNQVRAQEALVAVAEAKVLNAQVQLAKTRIVSPFDAIVTDVSLVRGEVASISKPVIKLISVNSFEVEAKVREIDVAKINVGDAVNVTLDTYGTDVIFPSIVSRVNPSAEDGDVPMYKIIISFIKQDDRIRAKMTANVSIITESKNDTLSLPMRFVNTESDGTRSVTIKTQDKMETKKVTVGFLSENGNLEILSGLNEGDEVVAIQPGSRAAQKANTQ